MLDIRFVRENPDAVKENIKKKFQDAKLPLVDEVIQLDAEYRAAIGEASDLRANRNKLSKQIGALMGQAKKDPSKAAEAEEIKKQVTAQADRLKELEAKETELQAKIQEIMNTLRENAPAEIGGYKVTAVRDYKKDTITDTATGAVKPTGLPASNVLYYELGDDAWVCVRPSGTEPKVKFYLGVKGTSLEDADAKSKALSEAVHAMIGKML